jgi:hypothetical protein
MNYELRELNRFGIRIPLQTTNFANYTDLASAFNFYEFFCRVYIWMKWMKLLSAGLADSLQIGLPLPLGDKASLHPFTPSFLHQFQIIDIPLNRFSIGVICAQNFQKNG